MLIKVCCIQSEVELHLAARAGATHVGLVGAMPSGPGPIEDDSIARIASAAPPDLTTVLLTSRTGADDIVDHVRSTGVRAVQIVRPVTGEVRRTVRAGLPRVQVIQVVHVEGPEAVEAARRAEEASDVVLLDSGRPRAGTPVLGGTGRVHDWTVSAEIVSTAGTPVMLAGGLRPENVGRAIGAVRPAGVDVCSGLRDAGGGLLPGRLNDFLRAVRSAEAALG